MSVLGGRELQAEESEREKTEDKKEVENPYGRSTKRRGRDGQDEKCRGTGQEEPAQAVVGKG